MGDKGVVVGIDLGTSNSCVAYLNGGEPQVLANGDGDHTTPSIFAFTAHRTWLVGLVAKHQAVTNPQGTVSSIKRFIGKKIGDEDVQKDRTLVPYNLEGAENGDIR